MFQFFKRAGSDAVQNAGYIAVLSVAYGFYDVLKKGKNYESSDDPHYAFECRQSIENTTNRTFTLTAGTLAISWLCNKYLQIDNEATPSVISLSSAI